MVKRNLYKVVMGFALLIIPAALFGQSKLEGKISDAADKDELGLPGANVVWAGTTIGATTNNAGYFNIKRTRQSDRLVISFLCAEISSSHALTQSITTGFLNFSDLLTCSSNVFRCRSMAGRCAH